ncbi:MAG: hypothetical protein AAFQ27_03800 [Pseudomonadota bacterium]
MSQHVKDIIARGEARIVEAPEAKAPRAQVEIDRNFELPTALYAVTVGLYLAFLVVMFAGLSTPGLVIPMAIFAVFIVGGFGVPAVWARLKSNIPGGDDSRPLTMGAFSNQGIMTHTGRLSPRDATIQMLILPVLIVMWGCAAVTIAALV